MRIHLIAIHYDKSGNTIGFRLLDQDSKDIKDVPYDSALMAVKSRQITIRGIELQQGKLKGSNGSFERYPKLVGGKLVGKSPLIVLNELGDQGYTVSDLKGMIQNYRTKDVITLAKSMGIANGKVVQQEGKEPFISAISGSYERVELPAQKKKVGNRKRQTVSKKVENTPKVEDKKREPATIASDKTNLPDSVKERVEKIKKMTGSVGRRGLGEITRITGRSPEVSKLKEIDPKTGMTIEQKLTQAMLVLRTIRPFYYSILYNLRKVESEEVPTMGVSIKTLYFNSDFVKEQSLPELVFVLIHEVLHVAMSHTTRQMERRHLLWNVACDLFINKVICEEMGIKPGDAPLILNEDYYGVGVKFLEGGLYNQKIDTKNDTPEKIYNEMAQELENLKDQMEQSGEGSGDGSGDGSGNQSSSGESGSEGQDDAGGVEGDEKQDGDGQSKGQEKQDKDGEGQGKDGEGQGKQDKDGEGQGKQDKDGEGQGKDGDKGIEDAEYRGKKVGKIRVVDLVEDEETAQMSDVQKDIASRSILERAVVLQRQIGTFGGEDGGFLERYVEEALAPKVNWMSLLRSKMTKASQTINTYSRPDKRFISRGMILPGPKKLENDTLENVKVCIDTSGSITDQELGVALAQIKQLLDVFKAKAELLYWDTQVRAVYEFEDIKELMDKKPMGGGGTDVNCVFEHFNSGEYKKRRKPQPSIVIIFTDGYFGAVESKHRKYRDTIWVIHNNNNFEPPFGSMAKFKYE